MTLGRVSSQSSTKPDVIKDRVNTAKEGLNAFGHRTGEASLLIRDSREDRLVLTYSTSNNLNRGTADPMHSPAGSCLRLA